jgi:hypothetical protein
MGDWWLNADTINVRINLPISMVRNMEAVEDG